MFYCQYCNSERKTKNSLIQHEIRCSYNQNKLTPPKKTQNFYDAMKLQKEKGGNNQYLKAERLGITLGVTITEETRKKKSLSATGKKHTLETKKKLSDLAIKRGLGGHTSKLSFYYKQNNGKIVYLQSQYEVQVALDLDKNNITWERPNYLFWKDKNGIEHRYYPDFFLTEYNIYLDPKNDYLIEIDKEKIELVSLQNNVTILVLKESELAWDAIKKKMPT